MIKMRFLLFFLILFYSFQQMAWSEYLLSEFLVAKSNMPDPRFKETVILMLSHNQEGAAGLIINKPIVCKIGIFTCLFINSLFLFLY